MKKFLSATILAAMLTLSTTATAAQNEVTLPTIGTDGDVMIALSERKSTRNFVDRDLTTAQLSKILWAANGLNRPDKRVKRLPAHARTVQRLIQRRREASQPALVEHLKFNAVERESGGSLHFRVARKLCLVRVFSHLRIAVVRQISRGRKRYFLSPVVNTHSAGERAVQI